mgnify:CR=1 FL=1
MPQHQQSWAHGWGSFQHAACPQAMQPGVDAVPTLAVRTWTVPPWQLGDDPCFCYVLTPHWLDAWRQHAAFRWKQQAVAVWVHAHERASSKWRVVQAGAWKLHTQRLSHELGVQGQ